MTLRITTLIVICLMLVSCKFNSVRENSEDDRIEAQKVVDQFYSFLAQNKTENAMGLFHPYLLRANDTIKLKQFLITLSEQSPTLTERKLDHWSTKVIIGLDAVSAYALYYVNTYKDGSQLKVSLKLQKTDKNVLKILSINTNPKQFVE